MEMQHIRFNCGLEKYYVRNVIWLTSPAQNRYYQDRRRLDRKGKRIRIKILVLKKPGFLSNEFLSWKSSSCPG